MVDYVRLQEDFVAAFQDAEEMMTPREERHERRLSDALDWFRGQYQMQIACIVMLSEMVKDATDDPSIHELVEALISTVTQGNDAPIEDLAAATTVLRGTLTDLEAGAAMTHWRIADDGDQ